MWTRNVSVKLLQVQQRGDLMSKDLLTDDRQPHDFSRREVSKLENIYLHFTHLSMQLILSGVLINVWTSNLCLRSVAEHSNGPTSNWLATGYPQAHWILGLSSDIQGKS